METTKKVNALGLTAIFAIFFLGLGVGTVTPAMNSIISANPDVPLSQVYLISTLPTIFIVIATILSGAVAGKKIKYRTLSIAGVLCFIVGGALPGLLHSNFTFILFCRALFGFGGGLLAPLGSALLLGLYTGQKQASYLGYGTLISNVGGIILQMLGGALAGVKWNYCFYAHLLAVVSLIFVFFLPEPENVPAPQAGGNTPVKKEKVGSIVWLLALLGLLVNLMNYPVMMNMSMLFASKNAGGPAVAAIALSMFTVGGAVAGLIFGAFYKATQRFSVSIGFLVMAAAYFIIYTGKNALIMTAGATLLGFGLSLAFPVFFILLGIKTPKSTIAIGSSIIISVMNLGGFVSTYYLVALTDIFGENMLSGLKVGIIVLVALAALLLVFNPFKTHDGVKQE